MPDPASLTVPADRVRWSDLALMFQRGVVVSISGPRSVADFLMVDLVIEPDYVRRMIATVFVDSMVVDDLESAMLYPGSTLTLSAAMPGLVGATLRRSSYYSAMRAEVSWHEGRGAGRDRESPRTIRVKLFNLIIPGVGPSILRRGIVLAHDEAARILGPDADLERIPGDREILLRVARDGDPFEGPAQVSVQLTIKLFASFQRGRFVLETRAYPEAPTVGAIVDDLAIPRSEVGVMMVDGRNVEFDDRPAEGSVLAIFPVIGGG